ncbi:MAG: helix-turn-helix transcriptional regulator [Flavobacterium sp.]|nr:helix-turn-helix transcriptional regulator [Flavobacterium sp.]
MNLKQYKCEALLNPAYRIEYEKYDLAFEIGQMVIDARIEKGLTQSKLAQLVNTKQPSIARLENGERLPSLSFLDKIATALDTQLLAPKFAFLEKEHVLVRVTNDQIPTFLANVKGFFTLRPHYANASTQLS